MHYITISYPGIHCLSSRFGNIFQKHICNRRFIFNMSDIFLKAIWEIAEAVLSKPPENREKEEIDNIMGWFRHRSPLFKTLEDDSMIDIIKNVKLSRVRKDNIIIRQGEIGHCFYIILKGSASVYAKKEGEGEIHVSHETSVRSHKERLVLFGTEINNLKTGRSFGESVMMEERKERNATVIADELTTIISIDDELYKRTLLSHNLEWKNKTDFVRKSPLFTSWPSAYKSLLIENLRFHKVNFGNMVIKQNAPCNSLFFVAKGTGKVIVEPSVANKQYKSLKPKKAKAVEIVRPETPMNENEDEKAMTVMERRRKRLLFGYVAMERRLRARQVHIAVIGENDTIGDLEMVLDLPTFSVSVECLESIECYELDKVNFHRLIVKRNPETLDLIRGVAVAKLKYRLNRLAHMPYYQLLVEKAQQDYVKAPAKVMKARPKAVTQGLTGLLEGEKKADWKNFMKRVSVAMSRSSGSGDVQHPSMAAEDRKQSVSQGAGEPKEKERRRADKKDGKKQYTAEEFRALKKKVQSTGKLIGRISD